MEKQPREITPELLSEFEVWTQTASMFLSSPEGRAFGSELREVIKLARMQLSKTEPPHEITSAEFEALCRVHELAAKLVDDRPRPVKVEDNAVLEIVGNLIKDIEKQQ